MKKLVAPVLAVILLLFSGCGEETPEGYSGQDGVGNLTSTEFKSRDGNIYECATTSANIGSEGINCNWEKPIGRWKK